MAHRGGSSSATTRATTAAPVPTSPVPDDWTEPARWAALPQGKRTDSHGDRVGFPHTAAGAMAALAAANTSSIAGTHTTVAVQLDVFASYLTAADRTPANKAKVKAAAAAEDAALRASMHLPVTGPLPAGAYVHTDVVAFKTIRTSSGRVSAFLLSRVARKGSETGAEHVSYTVSVLAVAWDHGDWKISTKASSTAAAQTGGDQPAIAAPGDAAFNSAGWTAIRQAS